MGPVHCCDMGKVVSASRLTQVSWVKNWLKLSKNATIQYKRWQMRPKLPSELSRKLTQVRIFDSSQLNFDLSQKIWLKLSKNATLDMGKYHWIWKIILPPNGQPQVSYVQTLLLIIGQISGVKLGQNHVKID